jgi:hypothetical protein
LRLLSRLKLGYGAEEGKSGQALTQSQSNKINKMNPDTTIPPHLKEILIILHQRE